MLNANSKLKVLYQSAYVYQGGGRTQRNVIQTLHGRVSGCTETKYVENQTFKQRMFLRQKLKLRFYTEDLFSNFLDLYLKENIKDKKEKRKFDIA